VPAGDYALTGDEAGFAIERKSLDDFLGTISGGWDRFQRELARMENQGFPARIIIVEADFSALCFREIGGELVEPQHRHPMLTPQFICMRIAQLSYAGVSVLFASDAGQASALCCAILKEREKAFYAN